MKSNIKRTGQACQPTSRSYTKTVPKGTVYFNVTKNNGIVKFIKNNIGGLIVAVMLAIYIFIMLNPNALLQFDFITDFFDWIYGV